MPKHGVLYKTGVWDTNDKGARGVMNVSEDLCLACSFEPSNFNYCLSNN